MDNIFKSPKTKQFEFDESVASVFDDMLDRSIPLYEESIIFMADLIGRFFTQNATIVDLGCSTANTLLALYKKSLKYRLLGYDNSSAMLEVARKKVEAFGAKIELQEADIVNLDIPKSDVIIANYMLQFIRPLKREKFVKKIHESLNDKGFFIFSEKIIYKEKKLDKVMIDMYLEFKKQQGYSEFEISQKREALENILVPYTEEENRQMIKDTGFRDIQTLIKWGNFTTFLALK